MRSLKADNGGATSIEYTLCAMLIALVIIAALTSIGVHVNTMITSAASGLH